MGGRGRGDACMHVEGWGGGLVCLGISVVDVFGSSAW